MKNALIAGVVGLLFMAGGFAVGFKMMPKPKTPPAPPVVAATTMTPPGAAVPMPTPDAISMDTLKKSSESMLSLNLALAQREKQVAAREAKVKEREDELTAERAALDSSHEKFKTLFNDFQGRLQLVEANQLQQLQKQAEFYDAMGPDQSIELIRTMDDNAITRLFSVMDTKPLAKLVSAWKTKYPDDANRLLRALNNTAQVMDKDKMALNDPLNTAPAATDSPAPVPAPTSQPDSSAPAPDSSGPAPDSAAPADPAPTNPAPTPPPDPGAPANPASSTTSTDAAPAQPAPGADSTTSAPAPEVAVQPDPTVPGATAAASAANASTNSNAIDPATVPVAQPASPADLGPDDGELPQPPRAKPVNVTTATTN
jgi:hypothetical protein